MLQPTRLISTPFAQEGEKTEIQNITGEFDNSATYRLGFPPITMQSIRLGGKPPKGTDFNGVLFDITENISFLCKGGRYQYNSGLSTLIGGYPEGSNLLLDDNVTEVVSTVAGNQNNPNTDMTGWILKPNKTTAVNVADASGETQQQVNYNGGSKWHSRVGGYLENERVVLTNGDIVKSTIDGNTNDPNSNMTGWLNIENTGVVESIADLLAIPSPKDGSRVFVKSIQKWYTYKINLTTPENSVTIVGKWEMDIQDAYYASWFATPAVQTDQSAKIQIGYDYATSVGRAFIVDDHFYLDGVEVGNEKVAFYVRSNSVLIFKKGVGKFQQIPTNTQGYDLVRLHEGVKNIAIYDPELIGDRDSHLGTLGEWGYLLTIYDCENVYVRSPKTLNAWGDGIHIGRRWSYAEAKLPKNIIVENLFTDRSRRNGLSLTGGEDITLVRPTFSRTEGIAPQAGLDIEPEEAPSAELSYLKNVKIIDATFIDNKEHFNILCNKKDRYIDVVFSGTTRFINTGLYTDKFSIYKYTNVVGDFQTGQIVFDNIIWTTSGNRIEMSLSSEDTGNDIIFKNIEFSDNVSVIDIFYVGGSIVPDMPWGGIEFRNILGKGLTVASQSKYFITNNRDLLKTGIVLHLPEYVDWVVNDPMQLVDSNSKNINTACTRFGGYDSETNKLSTYIQIASYPHLDNPIYLDTATDFRKLRISISDYIDVIGFGVNIKGLYIFASDGNLKSKANCKTPGGWIEFQNTEDGRTRIFDSYGVWTFS